MHASGRRGHNQDEVHPSDGCIRTCSPQPLDRSMFTDHEPGLAHVEHQGVGVPVGLVIVIHRIWITFQSCSSSRLAEHASPVLGFASRPIRTADLSALLHKRPAGRHGLVNAVLMPRCKSSEAHTELLRFDEAGARGTAAAADWVARTRDEPTANPRDEPPSSHSAQGTDPV